jgi:hypothetical protein
MLQNLNHLQVFLCKLKLPNYVLISKYPKWEAHQNQNVLLCNFISPADKAHKPNITNPQPPLANNDKFKIPPSTIGTPPPS